MKQQRETEGKSTTKASAKKAPAAEHSMDSRLGELVAHVRKGFGEESIRLLDGSQEERVRFISSGCIALDRALGIGGYPEGRIVEVFGPESSGKTTLTLHAVAEAQRAGGITAFIDAEHAFDPAYARAIGVDTSSLLLSQPDSGEQALDIVEAAGGKVARVVCLVDRGEGAVEAFAERGVSLEAIFTREDLPV